FNPIYNENDKNDKNDKNNKNNKNDDKDINKDYIIFDRDNYVQLISECIKECLNVYDTVFSNTTNDSIKFDSFQLTKTTKDLHKIYTNNFLSNNLILLNGLTIDICLDDKKLIGISIVGPTDSFINNIYQKIGIKDCNDWLL